MPRNGSGTYSLPAGNPVEPNTVIETEWANDTMEDIGNEITNSLSRTGEGGMLAPLRFYDGTESVPGIAWIDETSTGFYLEDAGEFAATVLTEAVAKFTSNGVTIPANKDLTVLGDQTVGGTLGVTGVITATGGVNGNITTSSATITGGTINGTAIGGSTAAAGAFTTLSASGAFSLSGDQVQVSEGGTGATTASGARTALGLAIGTDVPSPTGTGASGTWNISVSGNAATVSNGVYTNGSYSNPSWITSLAASKLTGTVAVANGGTGAATAADARTNLSVPSTTGSGASGTWGIDVTGNAGTVTNGVYTTGSYSNPAWITGLAGSKISGDISGNADGLTSTLAVGSGGTGQTSFTNGQLLIGNSTGNTLTKSTLTAGSGISITNGAGSITITATSGGGSVTSVDVSGGTTGLTTSGGPVTGSGTITLAGTLGVANGGTGATSLTSGYLVKGNGTSAASASVIYDNGTGAAIGTNNPQDTLTLYSASGPNLGLRSTDYTYIVDTVNSSGSFRIRRNDGVSADRLVINSSGDVTVGPSTANATLTASGAVSIKNTANSSGLDFGLLGGSADPVAYLYQRANSSLVFGTNNTERARFDSSGNFGIGVSPSYKLDVNGTARISGGAYISNLGGANKIINGDMMIDQRNSGASVTPTVNGSYTLDRWCSVFSAASKFSVQQNAGSVAVLSGMPKDYAGITSLSSYSLSSTDYFFFAQYIEGLNCSNLNFGSSIASDITLSFWVRSSLTGTFGGVLQNSAQNRSYCFSYSIAAANTWTKISIAISGDQSGTWLTTNGIGLRVFFALGIGSTYKGTPAGWSATNIFAPTGAVDVVATNGATWYVTGVKVELGTVATPFVPDDYAASLQKCFRYYEKQTWNSANYVGIGNSYDTTAGYMVVQYTQKRGNPAITFPLGTTTAVEGKLYVFNAAQSLAGGPGTFNANNATPGLERCRVDLASWTGLTASGVFMPYVSTTGAGKAYFVADAEL